MKNTARLTIIIFLVLGGFWFFHQVRSSQRELPARSIHSPPNKNATSGIDPQKKVSSLTGTSAFEASAIATEESASWPPLTDRSLRLWDNGGELTDEAIQRYKLTDRQISELKELKAECLIRMQAIDQANASVSVSADGKSVSITVKPDLAAAREFTDFLQAQLQTIFGAAGFADLAKYHDLPSLDDSLNAGLFDKQIDVQKVTVNQSEVRYHIKAESRHRVSPLNMSPAYDSRAVETTAPKDQLGIAYPGIEFLLPPNF